MTKFTHDTAPTQYAEGDGIRFAYRRFGMPERPPLVFFQHFMGTLDDHDPALSDAFAADREVIPTINSYILQQFLPNAELILYPDAGHGAHFQYPGLFVRHARIFLDD